MSRLPEVNFKLTGVAKNSAFSRYLYAWLDYSTSFPEGTPVTRSNMNLLIRSKDCYNDLRELAIKFSVMAKLVKSSDDSHLIYSNLAKLSHSCNKQKGLVHSIKKGLKKCPLNTDYYYVLDFSLSNIENRIKYLRTSVFTANIELTVLNVYLEYLKEIGVSFESDLDEHIIDKLIGVTGSELIELESRLVNEYIVHINTILDSTDLPEDVKKVRDAYYQKHKNLREEISKNKELAKKKQEKENFTIAGKKASDFAEKITIDLCNTRNNSLISGLKLAEIKTLRNKCRLANNSRIAWFYVAACGNPTSKTFNTPYFISNSPKNAVGVGLTIDPMRAYINVDLTQEAIDYINSRGFRVHKVVFEKQYFD